MLISKQILAATEEKLIIPLHYPTKQLEKRLSGFKVYALMSTIGVKIINAKFSQVI